MVAFGARAFPGAAVVVRLQSAGCGSDSLESALNTTLIECNTHTAGETNHDVVGPVDGFSTEGKSVQGEQFTHETQFSTTCRTVLVRFKSGLVHVR